MLELIINVIKYYPGLAKIRETGTFVRVADSNIIYRFKSVACVFYKIHLKPLTDLLSKRSILNEEQYFSNDLYLQNRENQVFIERILSDGNKLNPCRIHTTILQKYKTEYINKKFLIRYVFILAYLGDQNESI